MSAYNKKKNRLYVMGGFDGYECLNCVEMLDLSTNTGFQSLEKMPARIKNGCAVMNESDQSIYIFGGWDEKETMSGVFRFDTESHEMHFDGFLPKQVEGHACVHIPNTSIVFIFGGYDSLGVTDRVMKYDMRTKTGSIVYGQRLSEARENHVAQLLDGDKIIITNGWNGHASLSDIDIFKYENESISRFGSEEPLLKTMRNLNLKRNRPTSVCL